MTRFKSVVGSCVGFLLITTVPVQAQRYRDAVFTVFEQSTVTYRIAKNFAGIPDTLEMDIYVPSGDSLSNRPSVLVLYGGSFISGSRKDDIVVSLCTEFAKHGYVAAAIDYRIGLNFQAVSSEYPAAVYRAVQDSRAASRFLRKNALRYNLDVSKVFGCGYSAGAITVLHHAYLDQQRALGLSDTTGLGPLDDGDYCDQSAQLNAVVNLSGFIGDTNWISNPSVPVLSFHGSTDGTVPYDVGYPLNMMMLPKVYGSAAIDRAAQRNGVPHQLVSFDGKEHQYDTVMVDSVRSVTFTFLYPYSNTPLYVHRERYWRNKIGVSMKPSGVKMYDLRGRTAPEMQPSSQMLIKGNTTLAERSLRIYAPFVQK